MAAQKRGRKRKYDYEKFNACLKENQDEIYYYDNSTLKIRVKSHDIWQHLSRILDESNLTPSNL